MKKKATAAEQDNPRSVFSSRTSSYAATYAKLEESLRSLHSQIRALLNEAAPQVQEQYDALCAEFVALTRQVQEYPDLFAEPRSFTVNGVTIGLRQLPGTVRTENPSRAISVLRHSLSDVKFQNCVKTSYKLLFAGCRALPVSLRTACKFEFTEPDDKPFAKAIADNVPDLIKLTYPELLNLPAPA